LMARLEDALARSRQGPAVAVLFLDLDNFKVVNDSLGHHVGDRLLVVLAAHLRQWLRPENIVARLGGDEFMIVLGAVADLDEAIAVAERITLCLQVPLSFDGYEIFVTASIGVALSTPAHARAEDLVRDADIAMYRSKTSGKARSAVFDLSMNVHLRGRLEMETALRHAIDRHELEVHYQPVVDLATGRFSEVEALLRWKHPQHGMMAPTQFIPLAEETGLILPIGRWVLEETCRQVRQWQQQHSSATSLVVSVNLSARQLQHPALAEEITAILQATSLSPACLKLEITESAMMQEADTTIRTLRKLKHLGIQLAIDDFGTGYSSLAYLKRFPIDILKIDRSFVDQLGQNAEDTAIVQAIITLARTLNLCVTAEGIERADQLDMLRVLGCDHGQGYFFARPLPKDQLTSMLGASLQQKWQPARMPLSPMVA
jgi:diguanylate cyclase (GGDEF)-like protein